MFRTKSSIESTIPNFDNLEFIYFKRDFSIDSVNFLDIVFAIWNVPL